MATTNYARFTIDGTPATDPTTGDRGYNASAGATIDITLELSPSPARSVRYSVYGGNDDDPLASKDAPLITFLGSGTNEQVFANVNDTAQLTLPGSVHSYIIRCTVDAGEEYVFERMVVVPTSTTPPTRKIVPNETNQYEARSWADTQSELVDVITGLGGGHAAVTLNATAVTGGMSLVGQDISNQAATGAQNGYLTSADWTTFNGKLADPMTTRGDIIIRDPANTTARLAAGTPNQVLQSDGADVSWQTLTASDVSDFDTEVSNNVDVAANTTHRTSNGSDHTYIDQDVTSGSAPTFTADNFSDGGTNAIITTTQETNFESAYTHVSSNGSDHTYIDQDVTSGSSPTFDGINFSGIPDGALDETYVNSDGTVGLSANWDVGSFKITAETLESDVATGTAPLTIASTTVVSNLNSDLLDGQHGSFYTDADNVKINELGTATYNTVQEWCDITQSAGVIDGFTVTDAGSGQINISALKCLLKTTDSTIGSNVSFDFAGASGVSLTDNSVNWIYIDYNGGTPTHGVTTDYTTLNYHTQIIVAKVWRSGTSLDIVETCQCIDDVSARLMKILYEDDGFHRTGGMIISTTARYIELTAGNAHEALTEHTTTAKDTDPGGGADTFSYWYQTSGVWTEVTSQTQINNLQYNNTATGLAALNVTRYGVHWVFISHSDELHVVYGVGNYTLAEAQAAQIPTLPPYISEFAILVGKIIIQQNAASVTSAQSAFVSQFTGVSPSNHNGLAGLQGGTSGEYYHLTAARHGYAVQEFSPVYTLTDGATITPDWNNGAVQTVTLDGNRNMANSLNKKSGARYELIIKQDAVTGSRTLTWGSEYKWPGGTAPTLSTGVNDVDLIVFTSDGTNLYGRLAGADFS